MERRLIAKLHAAGQLRPSYLLRALREQRLSLFEAALATLGGFSAEEVAPRAQDAIDPKRWPWPARPSASTAARFPTLLALVRELNGRPARRRRQRRAAGLRRLRSRADREGQGAFAKAVAAV